MPSTSQNAPSRRWRLYAAALALPLTSTLVRADDPPARRLVEDLRSPFLEQRETAQRRLRTLGDAALDATRAAALDPDVRVRAAAIEVLGGIASGPDAFDPAAYFTDGAHDLCALLAQEALLDAVEREQGELRERAIEALLPAGAPACTALERRIARTPESDALLRARRAFLRVEIEQELDALVTNHNQYGFYAGQFDRIKALGPAAVPVLFGLFTQPAGRLGQRDPQRREILRMLAGYALAEVGDRAIVPDLRRILESPTGAAELAIPGEELTDMTSFVLYRLGDREPMLELIHRLEEYLADHEERDTLCARLAALHYRVENYARAEQLFHRLIYDDPVRTDWARYCLACLCALQKRVPEALEHLSRSLEEGYPELEWVKMEGDLRNLHGDPRYEEMIRQAESGEPSIVRAK